MLYLAEFSLFILCNVILYNIRKLFYSLTLSCSELKSLQADVQY